MAGQSGRFSFMFQGTAPRTIAWALRKWAGTVSARLKRWACSRVAHSGRK